MTLRALFTGLLLTGSSFTHAANCMEGIERTNPTSRFDIVDTQFALDKATNLMWTRCTIGYEINEHGSCEHLTLGSKSVMDATRYANNADKGGFTNWRLPNIKELQSLTDRSCEGEFLNQSVFPHSSNGSVWSSTSYPRRDNQQMTLYPALGYTGKAVKTGELYFLLVRDVH